ncbi:MAG: M20 family metallo-hydrolase [Candidatus Bathyarchaeota archaeon]|nr:M20 family metallo-hydrolase [Candidatus Bathyarchaeota archaeon]
MRSNLFDRISSRIDTYNDEIVEMQKCLTATQALAPENGGKGEIEKANYMIDMIDILKPDEIIEINAPDERVSNGYRPNIATIFNGKISNNTLWIITHLDVVPPGNLNSWNSDPFKVKLCNNKLIGRGVEDNQQDMIASYLMVKALRDENILPYRRVGLLLVSDEETGSKRGLKYVLDSRRDLFKKNDLIIVPDVGNSNGTMIEIAEKSVLWLKFKISGKQGHGSRPDLAINSFRAESHLVSILDSLYKIYKDRDALYNPPISTFEPTKKEANVPNINTIPGEDIFYLDCRILPDLSIDKIIFKIKSLAKKIETKYNVKISISNVQRTDAPNPTDIEAPVVRYLTEAIKKITGKKAKPSGIGGGSVAAFLRKCDLPVAVWATLNETAHKPNEYCLIDNLKTDAKVFLYLALCK